METDILSSVVLPVPDDMIDYRGRLVLPDRKNPALCLEEELQHIVAVSSRGRRMDLLTLLWGIDGRGPRTVKAVASVVGLSPGKVRQIGLKYERLARYRRHATHFVRRMVALAEQMSGYPVEDVEKVLVAEGIAREHFDISAINEICRISSIKRCFSFFSIDGRKFISLDRHADAIRTFHERSTAMVRRRGCASFDDVIEGLDWDLMINRKEASFYPVIEEPIFHLPAKERLRELVPILGFRWLDAERKWFMRPGICEARLFGRIRNLLWSRRAMSSESFMEGLVEEGSKHPLPPSHVIISLAIESGIACQSSTMITFNPALTTGALITPGSSEEVVVRILRDFGPLVSRQKILSEAGKSGLKKGQVDNALRNSLLVEKVKSGIYRLAGVSIDMEFIESLDQPGLQRDYLAQWGKLPSGERWIVYVDLAEHPSKIMLPLPTELFRELEGAWHAFLCNRRDLGEVQCQGWHLRGQQDFQEIAALIHKGRGLIVFDPANREMFLTPVDHILLKRFRDGTAVRNDWFSSALSPDQEMWPETVVDDVKAHGFARSLFLGDCSSVLPSYPKGITSTASDPNTGNTSSE